MDNVRHVLICPREDADMFQIQLPCPPISYICMNELRWDLSTLDKATLDKEIYKSKPTLDKEIHTEQKKKKMLNYY